MLKLKYSQLIMYVCMDFTLANIGFVDPYPSVKPNHVQTSSNPYLSKLALGLRGAGFVSNNLLSPFCVPVQHLKLGAAKVERRIILCLVKDWNNTIHIQRVNNRNMSGTLNCCSKKNKRFLKASISF